MTDERDPLEAGLEAGYERDAKSAGESVLAAIERLHGARSQLVLREADEGATPVSLRREDAPAVDDSRYQILGEVARGGVGVIYRGRDKDLNRDVALKVLRTEHAQSADVIQRFIEEAQVGGQLQHPGIVPVYGMGLQADGRAYFAMKFIKGQTLSALMDSNPKGYDLLAIFEQLAQAMGYAHSRGVIHRDLKPANVMIGSFGEVIVVDWGFAKVLGMDQDKPVEQHTVIATVRSEAEGSQSIAGSVMGTPAYMPPEQALGHVDELDERSDVFALGAILCEILTGKPPYTGSMRDQLLASSQCRTDEALARIDQCDAAEVIKQIARDCMQPLGENRPANAGVVAQRLSDHFAAVEERVREAELATIEAEAAVERSRQARRRTLVLAAVALVAILGSGGGYFAWRNAREHEHADAERRVAAALEESSRFERDGDLLAAISAAKRAIAVAETDESSTSDARSTLERLQATEEERQKQARIAAKLALVFSLIEKVFELPQDERIVRIDAVCTEIVAQHFGPGERGLDALAELVDGSELAPRIADRLHEWSSYCEDPKATQLFELALRIDSSHAEWRRAAKESPARLVELFDERGIEGLPSWVVSSVAIQLTNQRRRDEAVALLRGMVWRHPEDTRIRWALGWMLLAAGSIEEGKRVLSAGAVVRPEIKASHHNYAAALQYAGRTEDAERAWRAVGKRFPDWSHAHHHRAQNLVWLGRKAEARALALAMLERHPENDEWLCVLGSVTDDFEKRIDLSRRSVKAAARKQGMARASNHRACLAYVFLLAGRDEEAIAAYLDCRELGMRPAFWASIITLYLTRNDLVAATEAARAALAFQHYRQSQWFWVSSFVPKEMDRDAAVAWWRELVEGSPESAAAWFTLGQLQLSAGRLAEARESATSALDLDKNHRESFKLLADIHEREGRFDDAEKGYRRAIELGEWFEVWRDLGILLHEKKHDVMGADAAFARAVELAPKPETSLLHRYAQTRTDLGDLEKAIELYRRADRIEPGNDVTIARLGDTLIERGRYDEARQLFEGKEGHLGRLAQTRFLCGDAKGAIDAAEKAPTEAAAWYWLGRARGSLGDHEGAVAALERAVSLDGVHGNQWTGLALELRKKRSAQEVRAALRALVDRCPDRVDAIRGLFDAYFMNGDFDERIAFARELAARESDAASGLLQLARVQFERGRFADAEAALEKRPADRQAAARLLRARLCDAMGRYDEVPALLDGLSVEGEVARLGRVAALSKRIPAMVTGHDAPQDPAEALLCARICHSLEKDRESVFFCRQADRAGKAFPVTAAIRAKDPIAATWAREFLRDRSKRYEETRSRLDSAHEAAGAIRRDWQRYAELWKSKRSDPEWRTFWKEFDVLAERAKERTW